MPYYEFKNNDFFVNAVELNPQSNFWIYGTKAYYNNLDQALENSNTPSGHVSLYELNVNRSENLIYPFLPKGSNLESFRSITLSEFSSLAPGTIVTGSYPLTATISTQVYDTDSDRLHVDALKNVLNYYKYFSKHYEFSSSLGNKETQRLTMIDFPSIFYGSSIKKGSVELSFYVSGSVVGKLTDKDRNGELIQSSGSITANDDKVAGVVLYNEGIILLTGSWDLSSTHTEKYVSDTGALTAPRWNAFARKTDLTEYSSYEIKVEGTTRNNMITMLAHAPMGDLNYSPNPTYVEYAGLNCSGSYITSSNSFEEITRNLTNTISSSFSGYDERFQKQTFISKIGIFDENRNLIGIAKLATPVRKRENDSYTFKLKLDY